MLANLVTMRLKDMVRVHPQQITSHCSECGEEVGIYPSGQRVLREMPDIKVVCQVCMKPADVTVLAPGAELEPLQSHKRGEEP
ncbi:hypothetical protein ABIG06_006289 [Bradyrhizobium sp. USDA 326]|uniref:hypothetical protein n=1 Tax=unclassified Bradyrhizobium TaxID=2631580 RepID=UPI003511B71E